MGFRWGGRRCGVPHGDQELLERLVFRAGDRKEKALDSKKALVPLALEDVVSRLLA